jgi:hypothetical protein
MSPAEESKGRSVPEPGELVYSPPSSWLPIFFAFALALALAGIFAEGFMVRGWIYSIIGILIALFAFRGIVRGSVGEFFGLRREQKVRGAVLPVETIKPPKRQR